MGEARAAEERREGDDGKDDAEEDALDDRGLIDFIEELNVGADEFDAVSTPINEATERVGREMEHVTERMNALDPTASGSESLAKRLLLQSAHYLDAYAAELETRQEPLEQSVVKVTSSGLGYITLLAGRPDEYRADLQATLDVSTELRDTVKEAGESVSELRDAVAALPPLIKQTNRARNRAVRALDAVLGQFDSVRSYTEQSIGLAGAALQLGPSTDEKDQEQADQD